jgi:phosphomannomutase
MPTAHAGAASAHVAALAAGVDAEAIRAARLRATCRGGVGEAGAELLAVLGVAPGAGPRFALDADADRLAIDGLASDAVLMLAATARRPAVLVKGADTSRAVHALAAETVVVAPGELHLIREMRRTGAALAGEGNGGVVRAEVPSGRDGLAAMALILELLAREPGALAALPPVHIRRAVRPLENARERAAGLPRAVDRGHERGVEIERDDGAWALVRESATEPVARVTAEASSAAAAAALLDEILAELAA